MLTKRNLLTFQSMILQLQQFWADQGCVLWQPHHTEVGAGTMNPGTYLRVLGPEDWWVAYVEPSIRPADSRYGENPNRWGHYYQFQVILKPDPGDPQERFLDSLVALGIDPLQHDIRFVEDNWEQPALGAWGLGWEVWLDGQEITQFTYFQQAGGKSLDPVSVEITYGLERILLVLQSVDSFVDLRWNDQVTYGELLHTSEKEHSRYIFEVSDVERLKTMYDEYQAEANNCIEAGLVFPAHDYVLKCSHVFNLLDGRGAIGVTERAAMFTRMRDQARRITDAYLEGREELGFPWIGRWERPPLSAPASDEIPTPDEPAPFLLEIGTEELPSEDLDNAIDQLKGKLQELLDESRLSYDQILVMGTPRRLVLYVPKLEAKQSEEVIIERGPPEERAYDADGNPTKAALGFARSKGIEIEDLRTEAINGGRYIVAEVREKGSSASEVLAARIPELIAGLQFRKAMRWNSSQVSFSRPIRWLLALHGEHVIDVEYAGIRSGRRTRLLRFSEPENIEIQHASEYFTMIEAEGILLGTEAREDAISSQIKAYLADLSAEIPDDPGLLREVANLVEKPTALVGSFDRSFLNLPREVLISVMKKHQRYFPVEKGGALLPNFIAVRNGGREHLDRVVHGNEQVIGARFADADYFIKKDLGEPLENYLPKLAGITFQSDLGSVLDKVARIEQLTIKVSETLGLGGDDAKTALRAAHLCKADLATGMVTEMTSLQGEIGRIYAEHAGEPEGVGTAIFEHYLPRFAHDKLPESPPGICVGISDRLDTLMGLFVVGMQPTGARDPFALRRTAIGLIQILVKHDIHFNIVDALNDAAFHLPVQAKPDQVAACMAYITGRQGRLLLNAGYPHDIVEAVLREQGADPAGAQHGVDMLNEFRAREDWPEILQAFSRCARITRSEKEIHHLRPELLEEPGEKALFSELQKIEGAERDPGSVQCFFDMFIPLVPLITQFFDDVLVMAEEEELRKNRLALLQKVVALSGGIADFSQLEGF